MHRCKGLEYDDVYLVDDFITEQKIKKILADNKEKELNTDKLNEEINLLYVAVTRTKNKIHIPESMHPSDFPPSAHIHILKEKSKPENTKYIQAIEEQTESLSVQKSYSYDQIRKKYTDAYKSWTSEQDDELTVMYCKKTPIRTIVSHFGRTEGAIRSRIKNLELEDLYGSM